VSGVTRVHGLRQAVGCASCARGVDGVSAHQICIRYPAGGTLAVAHTRRRGFRQGGAITHSMPAYDVCPPRASRDDDLAVAPRRLGRMHSTSRLELFLC
jgi:hypothetical protein